MKYSTQHFLTTLLATLVLTACSNTSESQKNQYPSDSNATPAKNTSSNSVTSNSANASNPTATTAGASKRPDANTAPAAPAAAEQSFNKVKIGMTHREVITALGRPGYVRYYTQPSEDKTRPGNMPMFDAHYKGEGILTFRGAPGKKSTVLEKIQPNKTETGMRTKPATGSDAMPSTKDGGTKPAAVSTTPPAAKQATADAAIVKESAKTAAPPPPASKTPAPTKPPANTNAGPVGPAVILK